MSTVHRRRVPGWLAQFADPESITNLLIGVLALVAIVALVVGL